VTATPVGGHSRLAPPAVYTSEAGLTDAAPTEIKGVDPPHDLFL